MTELSSDILHASCIVIEGRAVLLAGRSGAGKSDLALRLIDRGAMLVADDRTLLTRDGHRLVASCPPTIAGAIEVRGLGIARLPHRDGVAVALVVTLGAEERMPVPRVRHIAGLDVRAIAIDPFAASAPIKVEIALAQPELPPS